jgi:hypothetical protein
MTEPCDLVWSDARLNWPPLSCLKCGAPKVVRPDSPNGNEQS